jgi:crotonobetainyl-CoA:carnitine CoA-transferase CaiB-like acyl-CoA transferase
MDSVALMRMRLPEVAIPDPAAEWAASGAMALTGRADGPALMAPTSVVTGLTRLAGALADTTGLTVDGPALLGERAAHAGLTRAGAVSCGGRSRLVRAADGWLAVTLARDEDIELVPAWLGEDGVETAIGRRRATELVERATLLGLPVARVGEARALRPIVATPLRGKGAAGRAGGWVIDLSSLWAGPLCGQLLTQAGCRVIKVESWRRPDGARFGPTGFFDLLHSGQESVALDLTTPSGCAVLQRLIDRADVVIDSSRPRAMAQLGVGPSAQGPRVWVSITGYGRAAEGANRVAFGDDAAAGGGLVVGDQSGPCFCADAAADPATGLYAAVATLEALATDGRWLLDVRLAGVAAWLAGPADSVPAGSGQVAPPRSRPAAGRAPALGEHTDAVLAELAAVDGVR